MENSRLGRGLDALFMNVDVIEDKDPLDRIIGVNEAAEMWNLTPGTVKNLCAQGKIRAKKIGNTWVIDKKQPNPKKRKKQTNKQ